MSEIDIVGPMPNSWRPTSRPVIFVDGGQKWRQGAGVQALSIGDGDSDPIGPMDVRLPADKDISDFGFALSQLAESVQKISLYGFNGGRFDHDLANLGELHAFLKTRHAHVQIEGRGHAVSAGAWTFQIQGLFSVLMLEANPVTIQGDCKYKLERHTLTPLSSHGLSNEGFGEVQVESTGPVFVFTGLKD
ncbi:MAG: hypothetical protein KF681_18255 [Bdellovibrionaceae bacterium]|nr:hypothetical protein [Pseudobdellovibrionaceae bacterium]